MTVTAKKNVFPDLLGGEQVRPAVMQRRKSQRKSVPVRVISVPDKKPGVDEDELLDVLLDDEYTNDGKEFFYSSGKKTPSETTSSTSSSNLTPTGQIGLDEFALYEKDEVVDSPSTSSESENDSGASHASNHTAKSLLARAQDRIAMQNLQEEMAELKAVVEKKNQEIENLTGQLRRAISTKCDLVLAHTELERRHENELMLKDVEVKELQKANLKLIEEKNVSEQDLLNELVKLNDTLKKAEEQHREELDDWERMHRNEMLEKDFQIAQVQAEFHKGSF